MKRWLPLLLLIVITGLLTKSYFHDGVPYTHDGENHLARFANYKIAVREGQIPPRFAPNLLNHYGYPVFNYNYPLANILSLPFSFAKLSYSLTFKMLVVGFVAGGMAGVWALANKWQVSEGATWIAMGVYGLSPYLVNAIIYRGSIGEIMALGLLPWVLWSIEVLLSKKQSALLITMACLSFIAFLLSHNVTVLMAVPVLLVWVGIRWWQHRKRHWSQLLLAAGLAGGGALWFWLPMLAEKHLVQVDAASASNDFLHHFPSVSQLLFSPLEFGFSYPGFVDSLSFSLGLAQVVGWVIAGGVLSVVGASAVRNKLQLKAHANWWWVTVGMVVVSLLVIVFSLRLSQPLWSAIPLVRFIQFPWRLALIWTFLTTLLVLLSGAYWPRWAKVLVAGLLVWQGLYFFRLNPIDYRYLTNQDLDAYALSTTTQEENLPRTFVYQQIQTEWQPTPVVIEGQGLVEVAYWRGSDRQYRLSLATEAVVVEPTMYFTGWKTWATAENGSTHEVKQIFTQETNGRIAYRLPSGSYLIRSSFTQATWPRIVGNTVSVLAGLALLGWVGWRWRQRHD